MLVAISAIVPRIFVIIPMVIAIVITFAVDSTTDHHGRSKLVRRCGAALIEPTILLANPLCWVAASAPPAEKACLAGAAPRNVIS
jgi:hypothetical protein